MKLDVYTGALPGRFQCDGIVCNKAMPLLREVCASQLPINIEVTRAALEAMSADELDELRIAAKWLGVKLVEESAVIGQGEVVAPVALSTQDREYYLAALHGLSEASKQLASAKKDLDVVHYLYGTTSIECMLSHAHCVSEHIKAILNAGGAQ